MQEETNQGQTEETGQKTPFRNRVKSALVNLILAASIALLLKIMFVETTYVTSSSMENTILAGDFIFVNKFLFGAKNEINFPLFGIDSLVINIPGLRQPERGEIVLFKNPGKRDELYPSEKINFVKRCIGLPGDTVQIKGGKVFINGKELHYSDPVDFGSDEYSANQYQNLLFPKGTTWTIDNYGPLYIPRKGDEIKLTVENTELYRTLIDREIGDKSLTIAGSHVEIDGMFTAIYQVKEDYFFVLGDNRHESADSRYWGFLPESKILGKVFLVYWSNDPKIQDSLNSGFLSNIRWNRIAKILY